jgi:murein L,D-transpeptidase YcbB/YkuD
MMLRTALLLLVATFALADTAADVLNVFTSAAEALINDDPASFLDSFDRNMPGYAELHENVKGLLASYDVGSTIEEITDIGDDQKRMVELDWLLILSQKGATNSPQQTRRQIVKCTVERRGKQWKITALEPIDFFKY